MTRPGSLLAVMALAAAAAGCTSAGSGPDESARFRNLAPGVAYTGDAACAACHEDLWQSYQNHGMARSWYPLTPDRVVESFDGPLIHHEATDLWYRAVREGERFVQEEIRYDEEGRITHRLTRPMDMVVGSGNAARTYLARQGDRLYELPLTWYADSEAWAFSPGYDRSNARFDRLIPERCFACHNAYPDHVPFVEGAYTDVPSGIGCERCHGPGALHVDERQAVPEPPDSVDTSILNPAHLSLDRALDVCQQCHLNGAVAVPLDGQGPFDFVPGRALSSHVVLFAGEDAGPDTAIPVISHADRMQRSACFQATAGGSAAMRCTTCHDPHRGFRDQGPEYFDRGCLACHADIGGRFASPESVARHDGSVSCWSCHMPAVEASNAPHASFTDHWIRVVADTTRAEPTGESLPSELRPVMPFRGSENDLERYRGLAWLILGEQKAGAAGLERGVDILQPLLERNPDFGQTQFLLGRALLTLGRVDEAVTALEHAARLEPGVPERHYALARAYQAAGQPATAIEDRYRQALSIQPRLADIRLELAGYLESRGHVDQAVAEYERVTGEMPWMAAGHYGLGSARLKQDDVDGAAEALERAIALDPNFANALVNLAAVRIVGGAFDEAADLLERAVAIEPTNAAALGNLGLVYAQLGRWRDARDRLQEVLLINPDDARARAALQQVRARMQ